MTRSRSFRDSRCNFVDRLVLEFNPSLLIQSGAVYGAGVQSTSFSLRRGEEAT